MGPVQRAPFVIASFLVIGPVLLAVHLGLDPDPLSSGSAALLAGGLLAYGVILATGLLLARGRWTTRAAAAFVGSQLALGVIVDTGPWMIVAMLVDLAAAIGLTGPWLAGWVRQRPAAVGPGPRVVGLLLGTVGLVPAVALAAPAGLRWQHLVLAGGGLAGVAAYSRSSIAALWTLRLGLIPLALPAILASPTWGGLYLSAHVVMLSVFAWSKEAALAATPLLDKAYGPRAARARTRRERDRA
jgi:hypothetical protein